MDGASRVPLGSTSRGDYRVWLPLGILIAIFATYFSIDVRRIFQGHYGDFNHFYNAARALLDGTPLYLSGDGGYIYPPLIAFLYTPLAKMSDPVAAVVCLAFNCCFAFSAIVLAAREFVRRFEFPSESVAIWSVAVVGALLNVDKIRNELQMLQTNALMFLMFVLALRWLDRKPILAGLALGVVFNIKYLSLPMLPYLLVRRRWNAAASFILGILLFAFLPALVGGWKQNQEDLKVAYGGLLHMVGAGGGEQANVEDITALFSSSITSAMARLQDLGLSLKACLAMAAAVAFAVLITVLWMYRRNRMPIFVWPAAKEQDTQPYRGLVGLEWVGLIVAALCFSPQTNTRHLFLVLIATVPAAALLLLGRRIHRISLLIAVILMFLGFILPPGRRPISPRSANVQWTAVGGTCWCLLVMFLTLLSVGMKRIRSLQ